MQYAKVCKIEGEAPKWKQKLDKDLTEVQKKEAQNFGEVISECFKTSGQNCRCEDISFSDFSVFCEKMSSLSVECEIKKDESACMQMENAGEDMPELPDYLMDVFYEIEEKFAGAIYGEHMPEPCTEAGVKNPKECMLIMAQVHAPTECRDRLKAGIESGEIRGEKDAKELCGAMMMPSECKGLSPKECGRKMMPPECSEKGLEPGECKKFMDTQFEGEKGRNFGPSPGQNCMKISDDMERLKCFESSMGKMEDRYGPKEGKMPEGEITWQCKENRIHWPPDCERFMKEELPQMEQMKKEEMAKQREKYREIPNECRSAGALSPEACNQHMRDVSEWKSRDEEDRQRFEEERRDYIPEGEEGRGNYPEGEYTGPGADYGPNGEYYGDTGGGYQGEGENYPSGPESGGEPAPSYTPDNEVIPGPDTSSSPPPESSPEPAPEPAPVTGGVISIDNDFWSYYF